MGKHEAITRKIFGLFPLTNIIHVTDLGWKAFRELFHVVIPKQLPDVRAYGVDTPDHAGSIRGDSLRVLHPDPIFTCYVVGLPVSDRLSN